MLCLLCVDSQRHTANVVTANFFQFCVALYSGFKDSNESSKGVNLASKITCSCLFILCMLK